MFSETMVDIHGREPLAVAVAVAQSDDFSDIGSKRGGGGAGLKRLTPPVLTALAPGQWPG